MDDSDDYFGEDDFTFDEKTLAVLDEEEKKWQTAQEGKKRTQGSQPEVRPQQTRHPSAGVRRPVPKDYPLPIAKKQKTSHAPTPSVLPAHPAVNDDYDDDLPDISIIGDGSYKFPAAQRETANELAAQIHGPPVSTSRTGLSVHPDPRPPPRAAIPPRVTATPPLNASKGGPPRSLATPATMARASQSQGPPSTARPKDPLERILAIEAALLNLHSEAASTQGNTTNVSFYRPPPSRLSPAPVSGTGGARAYSHGSSKPPVGHSAAPRHPGGAAAPMPRTVRGASPSVAPAANRRARPQLQPVPQQRPQPLQQQRVADPPLQTHSGPGVDLELNALRLRIEELERAQQESAKALEEAQNARYAKEGEVSILRKGIEKTAKYHAAEVVRLKSAKDQVEAQQAEIRKQMNEEFERMKTSFQFKQLELETSRPKSPWVTRLKHLEGTPAVSPNRRQPSESPFQTPPRSKNKDLIDSPLRGRRKSHSSLPESPPRKPTKLRGFVNAFEESTPKRNVRFTPSQPIQSPKTQGKGKDKSTYEYSEPEPEDLFFNPPGDDAHGMFLERGSSPDIPDAPIPEQEAEVESQPSSSAEFPAESASEDADIEMKDEEKQTEPLGPLYEPDWVHELYRIMFTHKHGTEVGHTLQLLMNFPIPASHSTDTAEAYTKDLAKILEAFGSAATKVMDAPETIVHIGVTLCDIGRILCRIGAVSQLTALLDMLKIIALFIPAFVPLAMTPRGGDASPDIVLLLCETVQGLLRTTEAGLNKCQERLAAETLALLEVICWHSPPELAMRLTVLIRKKGVVTTLVDLAQPAWVVHRAVRAFAVIASHRPVHKHFLLFPLSDTREEDDKSEKDYSAIPHIEQLAALLIHPDRAGNECHAMKDCILQFITTLAIANRDSLNILLRSHTLLPSIVMFLTDISNPLWEEHEEFVAKPELVTWTVKILVRIVVLLWHLFTGVDSTLINLRHNLMAPKRNVFHGLWSMFTVALGRISYAPPPEVFIDNQMRLEQIADLAKDVLEIVVDGPELEAIWAAFHIDEPEPSKKDVVHDDEVGMLQSDIE